MFHGPWLCRERRVAGSGGGCRQAVRRQLTPSLCTPTALGSSPRCGVRRDAPSSAPCPRRPSLWAAVNAEANEALPPGEAPCSDKEQPILLWASEEYKKA
mmetsp:Transcript_47794/g.155071  ORF Transcript_47794/g.155071 Transcript_47794/m.155071 type:complete len:100 (-) Transcript_47794:278-577(-)